MDQTNLLSDNSLVFNVIYFTVHAMQTINGMLCIQIDFGLILSIFRLGSKFTRLYSGLIDMAMSAGV